MGYTVPFLTLVVAVGTSLVGYYILKDGELPELGDQYWGSRSTKGLKEDISIRPFQINISEKVLSDLKTRLALEVATLDERIVDQLEGIGFEYGFNKKFLRTVTNYWLNKYDWRQREKALNKYPSFKTKISGIDIHFQHIKSSNKKAKGGTRPLLLLHGWPGSFTEYQNIIPLLVDPKNSDINFELVIPSLPGYGFSEGPKVAGLGATEMSQIFLKLMKRLGYEKFYVTGGDWGSAIASNMATLYKDNVLGIHMTMCFSAHPRALLKFGVSLVLPQLFLDSQEIAQHLPISRLITKLIRETGYAHIQATKPDTIGVALSHSPSGFASYILEKYSFWTNQTWLSKEDGGISSQYKLDELLDNVMVHWLGRSVTTGMRIYLETANILTSNLLAVERVQVNVPTSCQNFPEELMAFPKFALLEKFPQLIRYTHAKTGGHMNALELPKIVAEDIIASFNLIELMINKETDKTET